MVEEGVLVPESQVNWSAVILDYLRCLQYTIENIKSDTLHKD